MSQQSGKSSMQIEDVKRLEIPDGKWVLVVKVPRMLTREASERLRETIEPIGAEFSNPPEKTVVLRDGVELEVMVESTR